MAAIKAELVSMMNKALELEHAARIQYLTHAELITGPNAEPIIARLKEIAGDEEKHEQKFRTMIADYLDGEPTMAIGKTSGAQGVPQILAINLKNEKDAQDFYKQIYKLAVDNKKDLQYEFESIEHELRHVILDEQEHIVELTRIME
jgi:bacterioferritin (cytochrome b1)